MESRGHCNTVTRFFYLCYPSHGTECIYVNRPNNNTHLTLRYSSPADAERYKLFSGQPQFCRPHDVMFEHGVQLHLHEEQVNIPTLTVIK